MSLVKLLLETGAGIDWRNPGPGKSSRQAAAEQQQWTALHYASLTGNYDVVRLLLERGAAVEVRLVVRLQLGRTVVDCAGRGGGGGLPHRDPAHARHCSRQTRDRGASSQVWSANHIDSLEINCLHCSKILFQYSKRTF